MKVLSLRQLAVEAVYQEIISKFDFFFQQNDELRNTWFPIFNGDYDDFNSLWY